MRKFFVNLGPGWAVYTEGDSAWIKFNHKPDDKTRAKLREVAVWYPHEEAWRTYEDFVDKLIAIGERAETWESVGEEPPSWLDEYANS